MYIGGSGDLFVRTNRNKHACSSLIAIVISTGIFLRTGVEEEDTDGYTRSALYLGSFI